MQQLHKPLPPPALTLGLYQQRRDISVAVLAARKSPRRKVETGRSFSGNADLLFFLGHLRGQCPMSNKLTNEGGRFTCQLGQDVVPVFGQMRV